MSRHLFIVLAFFAVSGLATVSWAGANGCGNPGDSCKCPISATSDTSGTCVSTHGGPKCEPCQ